jgi:hypothetical protein
VVKLFVGDGTFSLSMSFQNMIAIRQPATQAPPLSFGIFALSMSFQYMIAIRQPSAQGHPSPSEEGPGVRNFVPFDVIAKYDCYQATFGTGAPLSFGRGAGGEEIFAS